MTMLARVNQLKNLGRFTTFHHPKDDAVRFRRLTLLYARNASGKTTITRVLAAAAAADAAALNLHRTLGEIKPPQVSLEFGDKQVVHFEEGEWKGSCPKVLVFDKDFIEANVAVGRRADKSTRQGLLEIALGSRAVAANAIDELSDQGRKLTQALKPHAATIQAAASACRMSEAEFLLLEPVEDEAREREYLEDRERQAITAAEVLRRPRPSPLPGVPTIPLDSVASTMNTTVGRVADEAEALVRAHLELRLRGRGQSWVQQGLAHDDGKTCPYCAQDLSGVQLVRAYRAYFDQSWERVSAAVAALASAADPLVAWWQQVRTVGTANVSAWEAWSDLPVVRKPEFDSKRRHAQVETTRACMMALVARKQARLDEALDASAELGEVRTALAELAGAVAAYNQAVADANEHIESRCVELGKLSIEATRRDLARLDARVARHSPGVVAAIQERARIDGERQENAHAKAAAEKRLQAESEVTLEAFGKRINALLADLCADFRLEKLGTERTGGTAAARFTLAVHLGPGDRRELPVVNASGEEQLARVLSDGDRSTLALAVFLAGLESVAQLDEHVLVFDDPMTSLDWQRCVATAERITKLTRRAAQVIVLSHHSMFLAELAADWRRFGATAGNELAELTLEYSTRTIQPWRAEEHVTHEHIKRWRLLSAFVRDGATDVEAAKVQGEIRKYLELHVKMRWPDWASDEKGTLEAMIKRARADRSLRDSISLTDDQLEELERLCAFGARGHHAMGHRDVDAPTTETTRSMAQRALAFGR